MDYLVFLVGIFLLAGGMAALFHHRNFPEGGLWLSLAGAQAMMAMVGFLRLADFVFPPQPIFDLVCSVGTGMAIGLLARFVILVSKPWKMLSWPVAMGLAMGAALGVWHPETRLVFTFLAAVIGAMAGGGIAGFLLAADHPYRKVAGRGMAIASALTTAAALHPEMVELTYDVAGEGLAPRRTAYLGLLVFGGLGSVLWAGFLWLRLSETRSTRFTHELLRRGQRGSLWIAVAFVAVVLNGGWVARWLGNQAGREHSDLMLGSLRIAAAAMNGDDLATMKGNPSDMRNPDYPAIRQKLLDIRAALPKARFVYTVGLRGGVDDGTAGKKFVYLVHSEEPQSLEFPPPGTVLKEDSAKWLKVKSGRTWFGGPEKDEWGVWFTALVPVFDSSRNSSTILGVDYPAREWLRPLALQRVATMGATLSAGCLLLGLFAFHRLSQETTLHVAHLSERLTHAMEAADFDAWEWYPGLREVIVGPRLARGIGVALDAARVPSLRFWRRIHPEDRAGLARLLRSTSGAAGSSAEREVRLVGADGTATWVMLRGRVVEANDEGKPLRVVGTLLNVQDTRRSRGELERQRKFAQHLMESVPSGLAVVDMDGRLTYVNRALVRMAMRETGLLLGKSIDDILSLSENVDAEGGSEGVLHRPDETGLPVRAFRAVLTESGGGFILAVIDLTSAKSSEEALLRSREEARRLALVAERTDNAVIITDAMGKVEWVNEGFTRMSGYPREQVLRLNWADSLLIGCREPEARQFVGSRIQAGEGFDREEWKYTRGGRPYLVHIECQPLKEEDGSLSGFMAIERDITRERTMEKALAEQRSRMDEINTCLLALRGNPEENILQLVRLVTALFPLDRCQYHQLSGEETRIVAESGSGPVIPGAAASAGVARILSGDEQFLQWRALNGDSSGEGGAMLVAQRIEIDGKPRGVIVVRYPVFPGLPDDFPSCLALVARALGREEVIAAGRRDLDATLRGLTVEKTRLDVLLSSIEGGVMVVDAENRTLLASEGMRRIFGLDPRSIIGCPAMELAGTLAKSVRGGPGFVERVRDITSTGLPVYGDDIEMTGGVILSRDFVPIRDGETVYGALWHYRDVTRVRRSARLLEAIAGISSTLLSPKMEDTHWTEVLEALGRATAVDRAYLFRHHPDPKADRPALIRLAGWNSGGDEARSGDSAGRDAAFAADICQRWQHALSRGGGIAGPIHSFPEAERALLESRRIKSLAVVPVFAGPDFWGFVGFEANSAERAWENWELAILRSAVANIGLRMVVQSDSDALLRARDEARLAAQAAEQANRAKSTFLAIMSHEIRTPLNAVIGMASLLETTPLDDQQQDYAETILRSSHFLLELINDVLDYSRIESGRIDLDARAFSIGELCHEAIDVVRGTALGKKLDLVSSIAPQLPLRFVGDSGRLRQILVNLLGNAVKFTAKGRVALDVDGSLHADGSWNLRLRVSDTGIGIAPDALSRLFEPFIQGDSSTTRQFGGSGLGLAISRRLAQLMDGDIHVESKLGRGSIFTVDIRLMPAVGQAQARAGSGVVRSKELADLKVMVLDDNQSNRRILGELLDEGGIQPKYVSSRAEAVGLWRESDGFDIVIIDDHLPAPDLDGLVGVLRGLPGGENAKFALVSPRTELPDSERSLFDHVLAKPLWPKPFHRMILELSPSPAAAVRSPARATPPAGAFEGLKVLVAEDNLNNQKVARLLLRRLGIEPTLVENGREAVEAVRTRKWDVVFLDIQMPIMDGLEASRRINAMGESRPRLIVALTANAFKEDKEAALSAGMDNYLAKPITLARLQELLSEAFTGDDPIPTPPPHAP
jgi:PAS domain S-box-containing protein